MHMMITKFAEMRTKSLKLFQENGEQGSSREYEKCLVALCDKTWYSRLLPTSRRIAVPVVEPPNLHDTLDRSDI